MRPDEPSWWYGTDGSLAAQCLQPLAVAWGAIAANRYRRNPGYRARLPVICIGNFTAGGTGKTPLALAVAAELQRLGRHPVFLTRGYGGRAIGPRWVDAAADTAVLVGDEPLLLARACPTLIARDRRAGAEAIERTGGTADVIVMDDGLQNPQLAKDLVLAVVDGRRGIGNGRVIPAGPLRAPLDFQLGLTDAVVVNMPSGETASGTGEWLRHTFPGPVLTAVTAPREPTPWLADASVVAFAGIGAPERFFDLLRALGARIASTASFRDHHALSEAEAERLLALAATHDAQLVTTEKDWVRLGASGAAGRLKDKTRTLPVAVSLDERDQGRLASLLEMALKGNARAPT